jgi:hypothetical protein
MCALNASAREDLGAMDDFDALKERAEKVKVKLERGSSGTWLARTSYDMAQGSRRIFTTGYWAEAREFMVDLASVHVQGGMF